MVYGDPQARGNTAVFEARKLLVPHGWEVMKSSASRTAADLVGFRETVVLVQVKAGLMGRVVPAEWNKLFDLAEGAGCLPLVACRLTVPGRIGLFLMTGRKAGVKGARAPFVPFDPAAVWPRHPRIPAAVQSAA